MTKRHHLNYENSFLKQKIILLENEVQELNKTQQAKGSQHANTLIFLQQKNSELAKALLDKTKEIVILQTNIHKQNRRMLYNNGDNLEDNESIDTEENEDRYIKPTSMPPPPPTKPRGWGYNHHNHHQHPWNKYHWNKYPWHGYPWYKYPYDYDNNNDDDNDFKLYRDISGNPQCQPRSIGEFDNPFLHGKYDERDIVIPIKKPTHYIPPARPNS